MEKWEEDFDKEYYKSGTGFICHRLRKSESKSGLKELIKSQRKEAVLEYDREIEGEDMAEEADNHLSYEGSGRVYEEKRKEALKKFE